MARSSSVPFFLSGAWCRSRNQSGSHQLSSPYIGERRGSTDLLTSKEDTGVQECTPGPSPWLHAWSLCRFVGPVALSVCFTPCPVGPWFPSVSTTFHGFRASHGRGPWASSWSGLFHRQIRRTSNRVFPSRLPDRVQKRSLRLRHARRFDSEDPSGPRTHPSPQRIPPFPLCRPRTHPSAGVDLPVG